MSILNRKVTYRLYPNKKQETTLDTLLSLHCRTFNTLLEEHRRRYEAGLPYYSFEAMCKDLTKWRSYCDSLKDIFSQTLQVTAKRVDLAFSAFFRRLKEGHEKAGYPRFKSRDRYPGWGYKQYEFGWKIISGSKKVKRGKMPHGKLSLSGIGDIPMRGKARFSGTPKTCEILHKQGKWYASITFKVESAEVTRVPGEGVMTFDWGLEHLLTILTPEGIIEEIDNPRWLQKILPRIKELQRLVSQEQIIAKAAAGLQPNQPIPAGTKLPVTPKQKKLYKELGRISSKASRQRHDFYHKLSALLVARFGAFVTEELNILAMVERPEPVKDPQTGEHLPNDAGRKAGLNRSILDAAPGTLISNLTYKAEEAGVWFETAPTQELKPTQRCHRCGTAEKKGLSDRIHECLVCNTTCSRDENSVRGLHRWFWEGKFWLGTSQPETPSIAA
jgi:putative transposase